MWEVGINIAQDERYWQWKVTILSVPTPLGREAAKNSPQKATSPSWPCGKAAKQRLQSLSVYPPLPPHAASWQELGEPWVPARAGPRWWFRAEHKEALARVGGGRSHN